jgi:hypothetical protein
MALNRYTLLEDRVRHLREAASAVSSDSRFTLFVMRNKNSDAGVVLREVVERFPGFASDLFLKRAVLFVIQLHRTLGYFNGMSALPIPADYQVPKMLRSFGCIRYMGDLTRKVDSSVLIPRHSRDEISIRAGSVVACRLLAEKTGWAPHEIDSFLWLQRKTCTEPFHLTVTTDY